SCTAKTLHPLPARRLERSFEPAHGKWGVREIQDQFFFAFSEAFSCFFSEDFDFLSFAIEDTPPSRGGIYLLLISLDIYFVL
ncbi:MAG: hypothetical protein WAN99_03630, partial [Methanoculleus sp.]